MEFGDFWFISVFWICGYCGGVVFCLWGLAWVEVLNLVGWLVLGFFMTIFFVSRVQFEVGW